MSYKSKNKIFNFLKNVNQDIVQLHFDSDGFTLAELIVASSISLVVLITGYSLMQNLFLINKSDEDNLILSGKIDNALDYLVDEINSGSRLFTNSKQLPKECSNIKGEFLIGIKLPIQALNLGAYSSNHEESNSWVDVKCPIIYSIDLDKKNSLGRFSYKLIRKGPLIDNKGYYIGNKISSSKILDGISSTTENNLNVICSEESGWNKKIVKGISICTDKYRRSAEITITGERLKPNYQYSFITRTSAATNRIMDDDLIVGNSNSEEGEKKHNPYLDPIHGDKCTQFRSSMMFQGLRLQTGCYGEPGSGPKGNGWHPDPCAYSRYPSGCSSYAFRTSQGWFPCVANKEKFYYKVPKGNPRVTSSDCKDKFHPKGIKARPFIKGVSF